MEVISFVLGHLLIIKYSGWVSVANILFTSVLIILMIII